MTENLGKAPSPAGKQEGVGGVLSRTSRLAGLLPAGSRTAVTAPPVPAPVQAPIEVPAPEQPAEAQPAAEKKTSGAKRKEKPRTATKASTQSGLRSISLQLPDSVFTRLGVARVGSRTNGDLVIEAINAHHEEVARRFQEAAPTQGGPLAPQPRSRATYEGEHVRQTFASLTDANVRAIDAMVESAQAPSRSAYVAAALDLHLPPLAEEPK